MDTKTNWENIKKSVEKTKWRSSYEANSYGDLFYALVRMYRPARVVELGTKAGYSAFHIARGMATNGFGKLDCYDLWEKYQYNSNSKSMAEKNLKKYSKYVRLYLRDVVGVDRKYKKDQVDFVHIDLGNEPAMLQKVLLPWLNKVGKFVIIEGGSQERDQIDWMIKYKKSPLSPWLRKIARQNSAIEYFTFAPFPSVTIIRKKIY